MQDRGTTTRDRILDVAQTMVQERGYHAVSFRELAAGVNIKPASVHYYFPAKEDLVEALVNRYRDFFAAGRASVDLQPGTAADKIERFIGLVVASFRQTGRMCLCGVLMAEASALPQRVADCARGFFADNEAWLAGVLAAGRDAGQLRLPGTPQQTAEAVFASLEGALMSAWTFGDEHRIVFVGRWLQDALRPQP